MSVQQVMDEQILLARAFLSRVAEPASAAVWRLVRDRGPVAAARAIQDATAPQDVRQLTDARRTWVDPSADLEAAERHGIRLIGPESAQWPHFALSALEHAGTRLAHLVPPLALWVRGEADLTALAVRSAAIVGSRAATKYGEHVTAELAYGLARAGVWVVSGGAYGIDAAAHRAALAGDGHTVLVSAGGLDRPYPGGNATLFERVAQSGLLISESPPGTAPQRHRFLSRNRLIAAFSTGVVITEAALRSGAANTASHAFAMGRPVMAVPGPVTSPMSAGCHALLAREPAAQLVTCVDDVLRIVGTIGEGLRPDAGAGPVGDVRDELDQLGPTARRVFDALPARSCVTPDEIALRSGIAALEVIRALPLLDIAGLVEAEGAGYRIASRLRARNRGFTAGSPGR
ncbi:MAG: DNA-processing protein DprA [Actinomycetota bacterium]|nr:DNA-processing protein DprA [Actinomycetota bacterium]